MVSEGKRSIQSGEEFDSLFPTPSWKETVIKKTGSVEDTMKLIVDTLPIDAWQTEKIAKVLKGKNLRETCRNIWNFVYTHIQYKRDKDGVEQVRSPRLTWWERQTGVDCDCYTKFIGSILFNLRIPYVARITKYPKRPPEVSNWQHVYPVVPKDGDVKNVQQRADYIVLDCVKDAFDDEQPYLEKKDYKMRLDYLDGLDEQQETPEYEVEYGYEQEPVYDTVEAQELDALYGDLGFLKKLVKKVGSAVKTTVKKVGTVAKKVGDAAGKVIRTIAKVFPLTVILRQGFLLIAKLNLLNMAGRIRWAYLTDEQAKAMNMNLDSLKKLRSIKDRAETVYWQAGGKKANLKKAILNGKANKDKKVPLNGLFGLNDEYVDEVEYNIVHADPDNLVGLGEIASGTAITAAMSAATAIVAALKQVKGLFSKGGAEEAAFQSDTDNAGTASNNIELPADEDALTIMESYNAPATTAITNNTAVPAQSTIPAPSVARRSEDLDTSTPSTTTPAKTEDTSTKSFLEKTTTWVKANPVPILIGAGVLAVGGYFLLKGKDRSENKRGNNVNGLNGLPGKRKRKKKKKKSGIKKIRAITL